MLIYNIMIHDSEIIFGLFGIKFGFYDPSAFSTVKKYVSVFSRRN